MYVSHLHVVVHGIIPSGNMSKGKEERVKEVLELAQTQRGVKVKGPFCFKFLFQEYSFSVQMMFRDQESPRRNDTRKICATEICDFST